MPSALPPSPLQGRCFSSLLVRPASVAPGAMEPLLDELREALCAIVGVTVSGLCQGRLIVLSETAADADSFAARFRQIQALPGAADVALVSAMTDLEDAP